MVRQMAVCAALALAATLALASCGSSSSAPLTRAELAQKANAICKQRRAAFATVMVKSRGDLRRATRLALPPLEDSVERLSALKPPAELKRAYDEIVAVERHQIALGKRFLAWESHVRRLWAAAAGELVQPLAREAAAAPAKIETGDPYKDRLFALPSFLLGTQNAAPDAAQVSAGLKLTGHFLLERVLRPHGRDMPAARLNLDGLAARES